MTKNHAVGTQVTSFYEIGITQSLPRQPDPDPPKNRCGFDMFSKPTQNRLSSQYQPSHGESFTTTIYF
jgi:hypothetical protein